MKINRRSMCRGALAAPLLIGCAPASADFGASAVTLAILKGLFFTGKVIVFGAGVNAIMQGVANAMAWQPRQVGRPQDIQAPIELRPEYRRPYGLTDGGRLDCSSGQICPVRPHQAVDVNQSLTVAELELGLNISPYPVTRRQRPLVSRSDELRWLKEASAACEATLERVHYLRVLEDLNSSKKLLVSAVGPDGEFLSLWSGVERRAKFIRSTNVPVWARTT